MKALEIEPRDVTVHLGLGMCYYGLHQYEEAIASYRLYLTTIPGDWSAWTFLASAYSQRGDFQKAIECQEKAATLSQGTDKSTSDGYLAAYRAGMPQRLERDTPRPTQSTDR